MKELLVRTIFPSYKLHEFYEVDVGSTIEEYSELLCGKLM